MSERDPLESLVREWKAPGPSPELDERVTEAYRAAVRPPQVAAPAWRRFWTMRVSLPAPALAAVVLAIIGLFLWLRPSAAPAPAGGTDALTRINASGFQPLPNGEAHVVPAVEIQR